MDHPLVLRNPELLKATINGIFKTRGVATGGGGGEGTGGHGPSTSIFEPNEVQQFQFQISGIFLFTGFQKLYGP